MDCGPNRSRRNYGVPPNNEGIPYGQGSFFDHLSKRPCRIRSCDQQNYSRSRSLDA